MKKVKFLPSVLMLVLCLAVLAVGIYAIKPTQNTIEGSITVNSTNPEIRLTAYYNSVAEANKIGQTQTARHGVNINLTDSRLNFNLENVNSLADVDDKYVIIVIENTADYDQAAYFSLTPDAQATATLAPVNYSGKTSAETPVIVEDAVKVSFSAYTRIPAGDSAQVKLTFSLLKLYEEMLTTNIADQIIYLNVIGEVNEDLLPSFTIIDGETNEEQRVDLGSSDALITTFNMQETGQSILPYIDEKTIKINVTDKTSQTIRISFNNPQNTAVAIFSAEAYQAFSEVVGEDAMMMALLGTLFRGAQTTDFNGIKLSDVGFYATNLDMAEYLMSNGETLKSYQEIDIPTEYVFTGETNEIDFHIILGAVDEYQNVDLTISTEFLDEYEDARYVLSEDENSYIYYAYKNFITVPANGVVIPETYNEKPVTSIYPLALAMNATLTSVAISGNITTIEDGAFANSTLLTSVDFSSATNLTIIGAAFQSCTSLEIADLTGATSLNSIGDSAFNGCTSLTNVAIPNGLTSIGNAAFNGCTALTSITLPNSLASIGNSAFSGCTVLTNVALPKSVTSLGSSAFNNCTGLTSITIPEGLIGIGDSAFSGCTGLTSVTLPESLTSIGSSAFNGCKNLSNITLPDGLTSIGSSAFSGCTNLTSITIPEGVTNISSSAFYGCKNLTSVTLPESLTSIDSSAFYGCTSLTSITIPETVTNISGSAFYNLPNSAFTIENGIKYAKSKTNNYFAAVGYTSDMPAVATVSESCDIIASEAFKSRTSLTSITIPDGITNIGSSAFQGCSGLTSISLPNTLTNLSNNVFRGCTKLTSLAIPSSVTSIGSYSFYGCSKLTSITIPENVTSIGDYAFYGCTVLTEVNYNATNLTVAPSTNPAFERAGISVTGLTLKIGANVTSIPNHLFDNMTGLTTVTFAEGSVCSSMGDWVFSGCTKLNNITLPDCLTSIGDSAFYNCTSLVSISLPNGLTSLGKSAFYYCQKLASITIPDGVTSILSYTFSQCTALAEVNLGNGVTSIGNYAFYECKGLISITLPNGATSIGESSFENCTNLATVNLSDSLTSIGGSAFKACSTLVSITIPANVTFMDGPFIHCWALVEITILAETVPELETGMMPTNLTTIYIPNGTLTAYSEAAVWSSYVDLFVELNEDGSKPEVVE